MKKQICFNLNGTNLYLDSVFVYFNEIPIFFTCIDTNENHYWYYVQMLMILNIIL